MLKEAIEKLVSLKENKIYEINGEIYSDNDLYRIEKFVPKPYEETVTSLDSVVKLILSECERIKNKIFVRVSGYKKVDVFTTYDDDFIRSRLYQSVCALPDFNFGWKDYESAIISLRSQFEMTDDVGYLLNILSRITDEKSITSKDNGITQEVETRKGISLATKETIRPIVKLTPYRTFLEVEQPESEFLIRLHEGGQIGLIEADGGMWKLKAKASIKEYLEHALEEKINDGSVVVMI